MLANFQLARSLILRIAVFLYLSPRQRDVSTLMIILFKFDNTLNVTQLESSKNSRDQRTMRWIIIYSVFRACL